MKSSWAYQQNEEERFHAVKVGSSTDESNHDTIPLPTLIESLKTGGFTPSYLPKQVQKTNRWLERKFERERDRERQTQREGGREREGERERERVCVLYSF